ncbi:hypothetical protein AYI70_g639 [Smittium culicis]|uniref:Uncharacterized protein n=1 Tax=Smittium culicis TaxID=133412 RepID=A0A1R1YFW8_9FUNG|nr:hypothetical protein AYI70_g639 [Smittium culicis]
MYDAIKIGFELGNKVTNQPTVSFPKNASKSSYYTTTQNLFEKNHKKPTFAPISNIINNYSQSSTFKVYSAILRILIYPIVPIIQICLLLGVGIYFNLLYDENNSDATYQYPKVNSTVYAYSGILNVVSFCFDPAFSSKFTSLFVSSNNNTLALDNSTTISHRFGNNTSFSLNNSKKKECSDKKFHINCKNNLLSTKKSISPLSSYLSSESLQSPKRNDSYQNSKLNSSRTKGQIPGSIYSCHDTDDAYDYVSDELDYNYNGSSVEDRNKKASYSKQIRPSSIVSNSYATELMKNNINNDNISNHSGIQPIIDDVKYDKSNKSNLSAQDSIRGKQKNDRLNSFDSRLSLADKHETSSKISDNRINIQKTHSIQHKNISSVNNSEIGPNWSKEARHSAMIHNENTFKSKFDRLKSDPNTKNSNSLWYL